MKKFGVQLPVNMIQNARNYLESNFANITQNIDRTETFYAFAKM